MSTTPNDPAAHDLPTPAELFAARHDNAMLDRCWQRGIEAASRHARTTSVADPERSVMSDPEYASGQGNAAWRQGDMATGCYWYGYAAQAIRLDPRGGSAIVAN